MRFTFVCVAALLALPAVAGAQTFPSSSGNLKVETVAGGLDHPWALAFLPDGTMLVTERPGRMRIVARDGKLSPPLGGVPKVFAVQQGGLLDVALDRDFAANRTIYFSYAEPTQGGARTAVARARLDAGALADLKVIFQQAGPLSRGGHFAGRIVQAPDGNLFVTLGDHFGPREEAQNLANHLGKVVRITRDGAAPPDNPFVGRASALPEIWSLGHRNPQGLTFDPTTGKLWQHEHGPRGGDEVNIIDQGRQLRLAGDRLRHRLQRRQDPRRHRQDRHGAAGEILGAVDRTVRHGVLQGDLFPAWRGHLFVGALVSEMLVRLTIDGDNVAGRGAPAAAAARAHP